VEVHREPKVPCGQMLRGFVVTAAVAASLVFAPAAAARAAVPAPSECGQGSWIAGTTDICDGELVYRDYVYDDFGARPTIPGVTFPQIIQGFGFQSIPTFDAYGGLPPAGGKKDEDHTDLVSLRLRIIGGQVHVVAELNSMSAPNA